MFLEAIRQMIVSIALDLLPMPLKFRASTSTNVRNSFCRFHLGYHGQEEAILVIMNYFHGSRGRRAIGLRSFDAIA
jgi:hypothetical protein